MNTDEPRRRAAPAAGGESGLLQLGHGLAEAEVLLQCDEQGSAVKSGVRALKHVPAKYMGFRRESSSLSGVAMFSFLFIVEYRERLD
ncbi:hypothetical protein PAHAL_8G238300 [Panicum hallii]|jgi:hypothetical protein|uniref:Uncharacterized protein n=1 Tax=Panicum hallii TaxID=206008 RepID=A0A2T8IA11_9POAL|nr:hypothetical protein PAHAL_8G238300 [Panicum hallii]